MSVDLIRTIRTPHSERYILRRAKSDVGALDIHYLPDRHVHGMLTVVDGGGIKDSEIPDLLTHIDEVLLPDVSLDDRKLSFTVVVGRVHGAFEVDGGSEAEAP